MSREQVYAEIREMFGIVPSMFEKVSDSTLELEWELFRKVQFDEGPIPNKYRELIGLGIAAATKCRYCALFHTEAARLNGATDEEIEDALHFAKSSAGWSTWLNGYQFDFAQFQRELASIVEHVKQHAPAGAT